MKTRSALFRLLDADFANQRWSWCAVHHGRRKVYFGMWDEETSHDRGRILSKDWERPRGRLQPGYSDGLKKISLVENGGYQLIVFKMVRSDGDRFDGPSKIKLIDEELIAASLLKIEGDYFALFDGGNDEITESDSQRSNRTFPEGGKRSQTINAYERSGAARKTCIEEHGATCKVCEMEFGKVYGALGEGFIHVHHLIPISARDAEYELDAVGDLVPLCPNCHAMVHREDPPIGIDRLRAILKMARGK